MKKYSSTEVFTPSQPAILTFVEREDINNNLVDALKTPGKQLIVYGHTGSGKTTLLFNKLNQTYDGYIISRCTKGLTFDQLVLDAFDQFGHFFTHSKSKTIEKSINADLISNYKAIQAQIGWNRKSSTEENLSRVVPFQLTPKKLAEFFGKIKHCWVIEDFHKMDPTEKQRLSQVMKVFMDESLFFPEAKIIALGAVGTAKEIVEYDIEMQNRVAEIYVPLMRISEIVKIIEKGEILLNIRIDSELKNKIANLSTGLASVAHQLCLNLCQNTGINDTQDKLTSIDIKDFKDSLAKYISENTDFLKFQFEKATKISQNDKKPLAEEIIKIFLNTKKYSLTKDEILHYLLKKRYLVIPGFLIDKKLQDLCTEDFAKVLTYDIRYESYTMTSPFFRVYCYSFLELDTQIKTHQLGLFDSESYNKIRKERNEKKKTERDKDMISLILSGKIDVNF